MHVKSTWILFYTTLLLLMIGVVMVYSTSAASAAQDLKAPAIDRIDSSTTESIVSMSGHSMKYLYRQAFFAVLGIGVLLFVYQIDYERYKKYSLAFLVVSFIMLLMVYLPPPIGVTAKGARRWLNLGITQVQVSEIAKLAMILYMAKKLTERHDELKSFIRGFVPSFIVLAVFLAAIVLEPDLGAAVMLGVIVYIMWYVSGMRVIHLLSLGLLSIPLFIGAIFAESYRLRRILAFTDPFHPDRIRGDGWQLAQSLISVGTGGLTGLGLGQGPQKYQFLSEGHTDFIYAGICEELGLVGGVAVFLIYAVFMVQGIRVATKAPDMYGSLIATGITIMIGFQAFINMYVVVGLLPTKGLTLPLISYGGSSLVINCVAIGILMNISRYTEIAAAVPARKPVGVAA